MGLTQLLIIYNDVMAEFVWLIVSITSLLLPFPQTNAHRLTNSANACDIVCNMIVDSAADTDNSLVL